MSCSVEMQPKLIIDDEDNGYQEWQEDEDIHLILTDGDTVFGRIKQILFAELTIVTEDDEEIIVSFEEIESWL